MPSSHKLPHGPQLWRLQHLIEWLRRGEKLTTRLAADRFEVSQRTIASDIEWLQMLGIPVEYDASAFTYRLTEPFENLPLTVLDRSSFAALLVAQHALAALGDSPQAALLEQVVTRLSNLFPDTIAVDPNVVSRSIRFESGPRPHRGFEEMGELYQAVIERRIVSIKYYSNSRAEVSSREVEPLSLLNHQGRWYLVAWCRLRSDYRDFRLDRIREMTVLDQCFVPREDFDLNDYLSHAFGMHRGERAYAVRIRFSEYQARWIKEEQWHTSQMMLRRPDGSLDLMFESAGLSDLTRWVLQYGAEAEVISPPVLRRRVAAEARRMAEMYSDVPPHTRRCD